VWKVKPARRLPARLALNVLCLYLGECYFPSGSKLANYGLPELNKVKRLSLLKTGRHL